MCLAVPGRVISINGHKGEVDFSGVSRQVDLSLLPEIKVEDYVLVHAGCAIQIMPEDEALTTIDLLKEVFGEAE